MGCQSFTSLGFQRNACWMLFLFRYSRNGTMGIELKQKPSAGHLGPALTPGWSEDLGKS